MITSDQITLQSSGAQQSRITLKGDNVTLELAPTNDYSCDIRFTLNGRTDAYLSWCNSSLNLLNSRTNGIIHIGCSGRTEITSSDSVLIKIGRDSDTNHIKLQQDKINLLGLEFTRSMLQQLFNIAYYNTY